MLTLTLLQTVKQRANDKEATTNDNRINARRDSSSSSSLLRRDGYLMRY